MRREHEAEIQRILERQRRAFHAFIWVGLLLLLLVFLALISKGKF